MEQHTNILQKHFSYSNNGKVSPILEVYKGILPCRRELLNSIGQQLGISAHVASSCKTSTSVETMADTGQGARMILNMAMLIKAFKS